MARSKPPTPVRRTPSETFKQANGKSHTLNDVMERVEKEVGGAAHTVEKKIEEVAVLHARDPVEEKKGGFLTLVICVGGIYASFLSWAFLQERITTTPYGPEKARYAYPVFLNTIQSAFAALTGYIYLHASAPKDVKTGARRVPAIFPSKAMLNAVLLISITSSLASPFGYASLKHIDYVTFILAKSCKLLPVMFLHITLFQKRFPIYKYAVVISVTLGVAIFTLHNPKVAAKASKKNSNADASNILGLFLLGVNLLFDGLTNTVQDDMFAKFKKQISGPQMMCAQNIVSTALTVGYLFLSPYLASSPLAPWIGLSSTAGGEFREALNFVTKYPAVGWDVLAFAACGAVGQVFIFHTLAHFSSILLVTVTVTRKMLTMLVSVVFYGHEVTQMQWLGVGLVFGGIGAEAAFARREKIAKEAAKKREAGKKEE